MRVETSVFRFVSVVVVLIIAPIVSVASQETYLVNKTGALLYLAPAGDGDTPLSYRQVPVDGVLPYEPGTDITGFAFIRGSFQLPTLNLAAATLRSLVQTSESGRSYINLENEVLDEDRPLTPDSVAAAISGVRIDNQYLDWIAIDASIARNRDSAPLGVYADFGSGRESISISDALLWQRGGTDIEWVKSDTAEDDLFLAIGSYSTFASDTSVFLYLYQATRSVPSATLEFPAGARRGLVFLWIPGERSPVVAGNLTVSGFFMEVQLWRSALEEVGLTDTSTVTAEVATGSSAAGVWEEYVLARHSFEELFSR
jgi:hypothetical protein